MGYRDDFYKLDNMIGYTGVLHKQPTVYFYDSATHGFGHITQQHSDPTNVGREQYNADDKYKIENAKIYKNNYPVGEFKEDEGLEILDGKYNVEWATNKDGHQASFHTSRGPFRPIKPSTFFPNAGRSEMAISVCGAAIRDFPNLKSMYAG